MSMGTARIFIVGCTRTGKTVLSGILNRSDRVCIAEETQFLRRLSQIGRHKQMARIGDLSDDGNAAQVVEVMYSLNAPYWVWLRRHVDRQTFRRRLLDTDRSERAIFLLLMQLYAEGTSGASQDELFLGEETPTHIYYLPTLFEWFPEARVIHLLRDPRAIVAAQIEQVREYGGVTARLRLLPRWLRDRLDAPAELLHITQKWSDAVRLHSRYERLYPQKYRLFRFEDMIAEPEGCVGQVCDFLDVPFQGGMLEDSVITDPSFREAIRKQQEEAKPWMRAWFAAICRKQLKSFGYA